LLKKGGSINCLKKRFFAFEKNHLVFFLKDKLNKKGFIIIDENTSFKFGLNNRNKSFILIENTQRIYNLFVSSEEEMLKWKKELKKTKKVYLKENK
jgi:hypothetical protein